MFAVIRTGLAIAGGGAVIVTLDGLSRYRRVAGIVKTEDPDHHRMVSPWVMTLLIGVVQVVVLAVVVQLIANAFDRVGAHL